MLHIFITGLDKYDGGADAAGKADDGTEPRKIIRESKYIYILYIFTSPVDDTHYPPSFLQLLNLDQRSILNFTLNSLQNIEIEFHFGRASTVQGLVQMILMEGFYFVTTKIGN